MGYVGQAPAAAGVTSADITDLAIVNADINASAAIAMSKTALVGGTGLTLSTNTLAVDASQTQITHVGALQAGSITSGFTSIDVGAGAISTTGALASGAHTVGATALISAEANADDLVIDIGVNGGLSILSATTGNIMFGDAADADIGIVQYFHSDNSMRFSTNADEHMRLDTNGNLLLEAGQTLSFDGVAGDRHTYIYEESDDDLHIVVGNVAALEIDQDLTSVALWDASPTADAGLIQTTSVTVTGNVNSFGLLSNRAVAKTSAANTGTAFGTKGRASVGATNDQNWTATLGLIGVNGQVGTDSSSTGVITGAAALSANAVYENGATVTNAYGIYLYEQTVATNNYALMIAGGAIGVAGSAGTDGQVLTSGGANANAAWEDAGGGGITEADQWRLTSQFTDDAAPIASNLERNDSNGFGLLSTETDTTTGMAQALGIFSFPDTGYWLVTFNSQFYGYSPGPTGAIFVTINDSTWVKVAHSATALNQSRNSWQAGSCSHIIDVTDIAQVKVRFHIEESDGDTNTRASTTQNRTFMTFIRLGAT